MASVNRVDLIGNLGKDPEMRATKSGMKVASFSVATKEFRKGQNGEKQEFTEWHNIVCWDKQAENAAKYLSKGKSVYIEGRLQTRKWEDKNGVDRYTTEIVARNVQYLSPSDKRSTEPPKEEEPPPETKESNPIDEIPF